MLWWHDSLSGSVSRTHGAITAFNTKDTLCGRAIGTTGPFSWPHFLVLHLFLSTVHWLSSIKVYPDCFWENSFEIIATASYMFPNQTNWKQKKAVSWSFPLRLGSEALEQVKTNYFSYSLVIWPLEWKRTELTDCWHCCDFKKHMQLNDMLYGPISWE